MYFRFVSIPALAALVQVCTVATLGAPMEPAARANREFLIKAWQTEDGLPESSVTALLQSRDGYLWLGTFNGLVRFDGAHFETFDSSTSPELTSSRILGLFEDRRGELWIRTEPAGLARLWEGHFQDFSAKGETWSVASTGMAEDDEGNLWFNTGEHGVRVDRGQNGSHSYSRTNGLPDDRVSAMAASGHSMWIGTPHGLARFENGRFATVTNRDGATDFVVNYLQASSRGGLWVAGPQRVDQFKDGQWVASRDIRDLGGAVITAMLEDRSGQLWVASYGRGLMRFSANGHTLKLSQTNGLPHDVIRALCQDQEGNLWVGMDGGGLVRLRERALDVYDTSDGLSENVMLGVCEDDEGGLWIGTNGGGLNYWRNGRFRKFGLAEGLTSPHVWSVAVDPGGKVIAGTWGQGLFEKQGDRFVHLPEFQSGTNDIVTVLYNDGAGSLWVGRVLDTHPGDGWLEQWTEGTVKRYTTREGLPYYDVRCVLRDHAGDVWVGSNGGGLARLRNGVFTRWTTKDGLPHDRVWALYEDHDGVLWIGTFGGGLGRFKDGKFSTLREPGGPLDKVICGILEDQAGDLWMSSYKGLFRARKQELNDYADGRIKRFSTIIYGKADGMGNAECTGGFQPSSCRLRDGRLCFPTVKGLVVFDPAELKVNPAIPRVVIEKVFADGKRFEAKMNGSTSADTSGRADRVVFPPRSGRFQFHYTGLSLTAPEKVRFKYKLEGLDQHWLEAGAQRVANYNYLPPGDYQFHVIACNNDNIWNEAGAVLEITVRRPFWSTWWFLTLAGAAFLGVVAGGARYLSVNKLERLLAEVERQHAVERERSRIAQDIHDDLGASLTQITLLSELAVRDLSRPPEAGTHIRKISTTARELTQAMDEIVWAVNPSNDTLDGLITYVCKYAQDYLGLACIRCRLELPTELPRVMLSAEERHHLYLACKEILTNIVKHATATEVRIHLSLGASAFALTFSDNGRGFDPLAGASARHGDGLGNMHERLVAIGGRLVLESRPSGGTSVKLELDFQPN